MDKVIVIEGNKREGKRALDTIRGSLPDHELFVFDDNDHYNNVSQIISEISCFGEIRLVVIKALPKIDLELKDKSKKLSVKERKAKERTKVINSFKKLFPLIPHGNLVVFYNAGLSAESFFKEVRKYGKVKTFITKLDKNKAKKIVVTYFEKRKIGIADEAALLFVDSLNPNGKEVDVDRMTILLKQMYNYAYGKKTITERDVYLVCSSSKEFVVWTFYNILDKKDHCSAIKIMEDYVGKMRYFQQEVVLLLSSMAWRYGLLLMTKKGVSKGISLEEIRSSISNINKLDSKGKAQKIRLRSRMKKDIPVPQYSDGMINSVIEKRYGKLVVGCYTFDELLLIFYVIVKTLVKIRSGCTDAEVRMAIKIIILVICGELKKKNTVDGILEHRKMLYGFEN